MSMRILNTQYGRGQGYWLPGSPAMIKTILGVVASHSSLQILHGARKKASEPWYCIGENRRKFTRHFRSDPDEWLILELPRNVTMNGLAA